MKVSLICLFVLYYLLLDTNESHIPHPEKNGFSMGAEETRGKTQVGKVCDVIPRNIKSNMKQIFRHRVGKIRDLRNNMSLYKLVKVFISDKFLESI